MTQFEQLRPDDFVPTLWSPLSSSEHAPAAAAVVSHSRSWRASVELLRLEDARHEWRSLVSSLAHGADAMAAEVMQSCRAGADDDAWDAYGVSQDEDFDDDEDDDAFEC